MLSRIIHANCRAVEKGNSMAHRPFRVEGTEKAGGSECVHYIEAETEEDAATIARVMGVLPQRVIEEDAYRRERTEQTLQSILGRDENEGMPDSGCGWFGLALALLLVAAGGTLTYYCAQIPCVGFLGVVVGIGLIGSGFMFAGLVTGVIKPEGPKARTNAAMICPHCGANGSVTTEQVKVKKGVSGAKATAAVLTGGVSVLATGLSRKEELTKAYCTNCGNTWHF